MKYLDTNPACTILIRIHIFYKAPKLHISNFKIHLLFLPPTPNKRIHYLLHLCDLRLLSVSDLSFRGYVIPDKVNKNI